jgi:tetratricopeptide (TPR) repeat protein
MTIILGRDGLVSNTGIIFVMLVLSVLFGCSKTPVTPYELKKTAIACMQNQDFECAEKQWQAYVRLYPNDANALANLGIAQDQIDENAQAIINLRKAITLGEGTYDIFAGYAHSLAKLGKTDDSIDWSYKALTVVPSLVDVRENLAKLLVQKKRYFEALALLASFDDHLVAIGEEPYFKGQRIAIESTIQQLNPDKFVEKAQIRLSKIDGSYFAPVKLGQSRITAFMVDTGAVVTVVNDQFLQQSKAKYEIVRSSVEMRTADSQRVRARLINIDSMELGAFQLKNVPAVVCPKCQLLLGQRTLSHFDLSSSKVEGVEFLTLRPR